MARPKQAILSRERIARTAIEIVDGGADLQVVPLAKRLGVTVSSLYHHVDGRSGIIHAMREVLSEEYALELVPSPDWEETIREGVTLVWRMYADHPRVMLLLLTVVIDEPGTVELYGAMYDALRRAGLPEDELLSTVEVLDAFSFGAAIDSLSPDLILDPGQSDQDLRALIARHPVGAERNRRLYELGLDILIAGIKARLPSA